MSSERAKERDSTRDDDRSETKRSSLSQSRSPTRNSRSPSRSRDRRGGSDSRSRSRSKGRRRSRSHSPPYRSSQVRRLRDNPPASNVIGVFGLSQRTTQKDLRDIFGRYGRIDKVEMIVDHFTGQSRGFGFVYFSTVDEASDAIEACNGMEVDGRNIRCDFSITKRAHSPTPGQYRGRRGDFGRPRHDERDRGFDRERERHDRGDRDRGGYERERYNRDRDRSYRARDYGRDRGSDRRAGGYYRVR